MDNLVIELGDTSLELNDAVYVGIGMNNADNGEYVGMDLNKDQVGQIVIWLLEWLRKN